MRYPTACLLLATLVAGAVCAQSAPPPPPLNLKLPANALPASSSSSATPAAAGAPAAARSTASRASAPGAYYGDTSGRIAPEPNAFAPGPPCDDATYNDAQLHGSLNTGVVSASHYGSGTYAGGTVNITKNLGDCEHHTGSIGISIGVEQGRFHGRGF